MCCMFVQLEALLLGSLASVGTYSLHPLFARQCAQIAYNVRKKTKNVDQGLCTLTDREAFTNNVQHYKHTVAWRRQLGVAAA